MGWSFTRWFVVGVVAQLSASSVSAAQAWSCSDHLTLRWAPPEALSSSGEIDWSNPAFRTPPFLIDPEILSAKPVKTRLAPGQAVEVTFASAPASILSRESRKHVGDFVIVMLGDAVIAKPKLWQALDDARVVHLGGTFEDEQLHELARALEHRPGSCVPYTS